MNSNKLKKLVPNIKDLYYPSPHSKKESYPFNFYSISKIDSGKKIEN